jgi:hypothetical protein
MGFWENYRVSELDNLLRIWRSWTNENPRWLLMLARVVPKSVHRPKMPGGWILVKGDGAITPTLMRFLAEL